MSLRTSREGFEGFGLQAKPRPAVCRRIPPSPPVTLKMPAVKRAFFWRGEAKSLRTSRGGFEDIFSVIERVVSTISPSMIRDQAIIKFHFWASKCPVLCHAPPHALAPHPKRVGLKLVSHEANDVRL